VTFFKNERKNVALKKLSGFGKPLKKGRVSPFSTATRFPHQEGGGGGGEGGHVPSVLALHLHLLTFTCFVAVKKYRFRIQKRDQF